MVFFVRFEPIECGGFTSNFLDCLSLTFEDVLLPFLICRLFVLLSWSNRDFVAVMLILEDCDLFLFGTITLLLLWASALFRAALLFLVLISLASEEMLTSSRRWSLTLDSLLRILLDCGVLIAEAALS